MAQLIPTDNLARSAWRQTIRQREASSEQQLVEEEISRCNRLTRWLFGGSMRSATLQQVRARQASAQARGDAAESAVTRALVTALPAGWPVLHSLVIEGRWDLCEIDHLVVAPAGCLVLETKAARNLGRRDLMEQAQRQTQGHGRVVRRWLDLRGFRLPVHEALVLPNSPRTGCEQTLSGLTICHGIRSALGWCLRPRRPVLPAAGQATVATALARAGAEEVAAVSLARAG